MATVSQTIRNFIIWRVTSLVLAHYQPHPTPANCGNCCASSVFVHGKLLYECSSLSACPLHQDVSPHTYNNCSHQNLFLKICLSTTPPVNNFVVVLKQILKKRFWCKQLLYTFHAAYPVTVDAVMLAYK